MKLAGLRVATELQVRDLPIHCNPMFIVNQVKGDYTTHHWMMRLYLAKAKTFLDGFDKYKIQQIPGYENGHTNIGKHHIHHGLCTMTNDLVRVPRYLKHSQA